MRIRNKLHISTLFSVVTIFAVGLAIFISFQKLNEVRKKEKMTDEIVRGLFQLTILNNDYMIHNTRRSQIQWLLKHDSLTKLLSTIEFEERRKQNILRNITENHKDIRALFSEMNSRRKRYGPERDSKVHKQLEERLVNQILIKSQEMESDAYQLTKESREELLAAQYRSNLLIMALIVSLAAIIAISSFFVARSIVKPIDELQEEIEIIGTGDLGHKVGTEAKDEIGQLSRAFDQMVDNLAKVMASRNELEKEMCERQLAEEALRESEERYHAIFEQAGDSIVLVDVETGELVEFNKMAHENLGYSRDEFKKLKIFDIDPDETISEEPLKRIKIRAQKGVFKFEARHKTKDGEIRDVKITGKAVNIQGKKLTLAIWEDITERKKAEEQIKASLKEKEVLLSEIHHRVKNNMQVISSLLKIQSDKIQDKEYADMFKESQDRIKSMALIHEKLYRSEDFANVDFQGYVKSLVNGLFRSYGIDTNKIALKLEIEDISLGIKTAIPCGLLVNELVSNSFKHAFPEGKKGEISITLRSINEDEFELIVSDDGVGIPDGLDFKNTESLGLELVMILAEDQLEGKVELNRTGGTKYIIQLKRQT